MRNSHEQVSTDRLNFTTNLFNDNSHRKDRTTPTALIKYKQPPKTGCPESVISKMNISIGSEFAIKKEEIDMSSKTPYGTCELAATDNEDKFLGVVHQEQFPNKSDAKTEERKRLLLLQKRMMRNREALQRSSSKENIRKKTDFILTATDLKGMIAQERKAIRCGTMQQFGTMVNSNVHVHNRQDSGICMKKMEVNGRTEEQRWHKNHNLFEPLHNLSTIEQLKIENAYLDSESGEEEFQPYPQTQSKEEPGIHGNGNENNGGTQERKSVFENKYGLRGRTTEGMQLRLQSISNILHEQPSLIIDGFSQTFEHCFFNPETQPHNNFRLSLRQSDTNMGNNKKKTQQITTVPTQCISQSKVEGEYVIGGQGVGESNVMVKNNCQIRIRRTDSECRTAKAKDYKQEQKRMSSNKNKEIEGEGGGEGEVEGSESKVKTESSQPLETPFDEEALLSKRQMMTAARYDRHKSKQLHTPLALENPLNMTKATSLYRNPMSVSSKAVGGYAETNDYRAIHHKLELIAPFKKYFRGRKHASRGKNMNNRSIYRECEQRDRLKIEEDGDKGSWMEKEKENLRERRVRNDGKDNFARQKEWLKDMRFTLAHVSGTRISQLVNTNEQRRGEK